MIVKFFVIMCSISPLSKHLELKNIDYILYYDVPTDKSIGGNYEYNDI